jgi:hypothetical protein
MRITIGSSGSGRQQRVRATTEGQGDNRGERKDRLNLATLAVTYEPVRWATLKRYFWYQQRTSRDFLGGDFNSTIVGIDLTLQLQWGTNRPARRCSNDRAF